MPCVRRAAAWPDKGLGEHVQPVSLGGLNRATTSAVDRHPDGLAPALLDRERHVAEHSREPRFASRVVWGSRRAATAAAGTLGSDTSDALERELAALVGCARSMDDRP